ncbi:MAG: GNAT family N-acetyltransferase [Lachnospiraceae bacterium]|nr:GNAT family N-acetyltransferase [Lachnospiraceae bacterium]
MDNFVDERDFKILEDDKYTFFVLRHIMGGKCELLMTDHERLIICFTSKPFPIWIWTPDDASKEEMEKAYQIATEHSLLNGKYRFNLKYNLAKFFIEKAAGDGKTLSISVNMFAYDCQHLVEPTKTADGSIHRCNSEDIDELVDFMDLFHKEIGIDQRDCDDYRIDAEAFINTGNMFFWKDEQGNNVASCKFAPEENMASINLVFTRPKFRRKHYAENLVYQVTKLVIDAGYVPMLYTDADYTASNACYEKIGYVLRGRLCTIG